MSMLDRRSFLKSAAGITLALQGRPSPAVPAVRRKIRGVLWIWMDGGMCPAHTWDPQSGRTARCDVKAVPTTVPGIQVSELLPVCASQMKHLTIIRSLTHGFGDLDMATSLMHLGDLSGPMSELAPIGTILACELGPKEFPLPKYVSIGGPTVPERSGFGPDCLPFRIDANSPSSPIPNLRRSVDAMRDRDRSELLFDQNREWSARRLQPEVERLEREALRSEALMNTPLLRAFNTDEEPAALRAEYGEGFGRQCLLGRRLVQAGCPFIEIGIEGRRSIPCGCETYSQRVKTLDRGLGTLIKDLAQKDLLAETLVVCASPFGRVPRPSDGAPFSVVLAGGCLPGGMAYNAAPVRVKDLFATIFAVCGIDWDKEYRTESLKKKTYASGGWPIEELF